MHLCPLVRRLCILASGLFLFALPRFSEAQTTVPRPRVAQAVSNSQLVQLKGNVHPLAQAQFDQGAVDDAQPMSRMLLLLQRSPEQEASLRQLLDDQQSKSSPNFHKWLTPEAFGAQFGIADADLQAVTQWLSSQGFTNINVGPGHSVIEFSGTVAQVRTAFHTDIHHFRVGGQDHVANTIDPQIPAALAPVVNGIVSLHNFPRKSHARIKGQFRRQVGQPGLIPLLTFPNPFGSGGTFYGMGPGDFATIYNSKPLITAGNDGTGQTIAIVGETNIRLQDIQSFRTMFGLPANFDSSNIILNGADPGITSTDEEGEADLDVEWSGATAPGATVKFVVSASTPASAGIDLSALYIIEHNLAGVMSESYGACEADLGAAGNAFYNGLWQQAAAQGITVVVSAGDGGSAGCDNFNNESVATHGLAVSGLASTPYNISLGGTDFDEVNRWTTFWNSSNDSTGTSAKSYIQEIPWNENCAQIGLTGCGASAPSGSLNIVAGSGGPSSVYAKPTWQMGVTGMPADNHRDQPDVSLLASPGFNGTGYVYCQTDAFGLAVCDITNAVNGSINFGVIGGTSASAPAFAGVMALVNHKQATSSNPAPRQGNANYILYALAKKTGASCASSTTEASTCVFNDVVGGNSVLPTGQHGIGTNSVPCKGGTLNCSVTVASQNGVLVDPSHTTTEAWTVTPGYDMVTGLGSLNITNLANAWATTSTIATTTTLNMSQTTGITHGAENVPISITVKPNTGTGVAAGNVSLIAVLADGSTEGIDQFPLSNGAVIATHTQNLPGGTYNVQAHYSGDGTNAPSDSAAVQVTVGSETSQTFIVIPSFDINGNQTSGNASSLTYGSNYIIRMYVTDKNAIANPNGAPAPTCDTVNERTCPTNTVSLTANGSPVDGNAGVFNLNNDGYTRDIAPTLTGGTYSLLAHYNGDSSYQPSTSAAHSLTIAPAPVMVNLTGLTTHAVIGDSLPLSAIVDTNLYGTVTPTGTITFFDGTTPLAAPVTYTSIGGMPTLESRIIGSTTISISTAGQHSYTAKYSGDPSYTSGVSSAETLNAFYPTTMSLTPSSSSTNYGNPVTLTAKVVGASLTPAMSGQIIFFVGQTSQPGTSTTLTNDGSGNQVLTSTLTVTPQGPFSPSAQFSQDPNFDSNFAQTFVNVIIPDFSLSTSPVTPITAGQSQNVMITVTPASSTPSTVNLSLANSAIPSGMTISLNPSTVNLNGAPVNVIATITTTGPGGGAGSQAVHPNFSMAAPQFPGSQRPGLPLLILSFFLAALALLVSAWRNQNLARAVFTSLVLLLVFIPGCGGGSGSTGVSGPPPPTATTTTLTTNTAKVAQGQSLTFTAVVSGAGQPTGQVNIFLGTLGGPSSGITPPISLVSGKATTTVMLGPGPGTYPFWAQYLGDVHNLSSQSTSNLQEVITGTTQINYTAQTGGLTHQGAIQINLQ